MGPPIIQNTVGVCKQIIIIILYYISSRLLTFLNFIDAPIQVGDRGGTVVKVLCYKSEGRWFDSVCFES